MSDNINTQMYTRWWLYFFGYLNSTRSAVEYRERLLDISNSAWSAYEHIFIYFVGNRHMKV